MYIILHIQFSNEDKTLSHRGKYIIRNNKNKQIGNLTYIFFENNSPQYMMLSDIIFEKEYRNIGLGSMTLDLFETRAKSYGAHYITGDLSPVDEEKSADEELRNNFYLKRGYKIINSGKIYKSLNSN